MEPLWSLSARELARRIRAGETTAFAAVEACLERIAEREEAIRAWAFLDPALALEQAARLDRADAKGPLHGVPVAVKDLFDTADMPTAYGSKIYAGHRPARDAACVARLRAAGAVVLGKTVTTEFATFCPGKTRNPHNPGHTPGGSSSGSAAAVAARMVPLAFGSQTVGSVVRPAAFCGVVGYKADHGLFPLDGVKPLAGRLDSPGVFARSVDDVRLIAGALLGKLQDFSGALPDRPPRAALVRTPHWDQARPESREAVLQTADLLKNAGAAVDEPALPAEFDTLAAVQNTLFLAGAANSLRPEWTAHRAELSPQLQALLEEAMARDPAEAAAAEATAERCRRYLDGFFKEYDFIVAPAVVGEAPVGLEKTGDPLFNRMWTVLHGPCLSLPGFTGTTGLPVGVQLIGARGTDAALLAWAQWLSDRLPEPCWPA
jgi:Asp-tRNA(Asn)/Glu-tRNA(Gln) amidotransferase A subunit family amidase